MRIKQSDLKLLIDDLYFSGIKTTNLNKYCDYAFNKISEYIKIDSASLNLCTFENNKLTELKCLFFKQPQEMESSYARNSQFDFFTPVLISNRFNTFHAMGLISQEQFQDSDLFLKHCRQFYVHNSIAVGSRFPGHKNKFIIIYLYSQESTRLFLDEDIAFLNSIFPALFTTIRNQLDFICSDTMKDEIMALKSICNSPEQIKLIRYIVNHPTCTRKEISKKLNKSPSTVDTQLQTIFDKLAFRKDYELDLEKWNLRKL